MRRDTPIAKSISWESVLVANTLAAVSVGLFLSQWHGGPVKSGSRP